MKKDCPHYKYMIGEATGKRGCDLAGTYYEYRCTGCGSILWDDEFQYEPDPLGVEDK